MNKLHMLVAWIRDLGLQPAEAVRLTTTAPYQYRHYTIPKKTGGVRDIYHPTPALKEAQRWLVRTVLAPLPTHPAVHSYMPGRSIRTHADAHRDSNYLLRLDFTEFFPSIDQAWIKRFLKSPTAADLVSLDTDALNLITRVLCRYNAVDRTMALSIGAPSSPFMSNVMLYALDTELCSIAQNHGCVYTRYADDVYFSSRLPNKLHEVEQLFRATLLQLTPELRVNEAKTERRSRKTRRVVTGVTITSDRRLSIGRDRKRHIRTRVHLFSIGKLELDAALQLAGLVSFANDIEPEFVLSLRRKFGDSVVNELLTHSFSQGAA